jgi:hypothetical protein
MRSLLTGLISAVAVLATTAAGAVPPDTLDSYRIVPRRSGLIRSGGFAGVDQRYPVEGTYGFAQQWEGGTAMEPLTVTASFVETDIRALLGPMLPAFIDVGRLLNLEALRGEPFPILGAPFDVYRFRGTINDGIPASPLVSSPLESSTIELYAALAGPWMFVYGFTTPPDATADYFEYELRTVARRGPWADWNSDGVIDAADYTALRDEQALSAASDLDMATPLSEWRTQFGEAAPSANAFADYIKAAVSPTAAAVAVPEPACLVLVLVGLSLARRR